MPTILYATEEVPCFLPHQYDPLVPAPFPSPSGFPSNAQSSGLSPHSFYPTHTDLTLLTTACYTLQPCKAVLLKQFTCMQTA